MMIFMSWKIIEHLCPACNKRFENLADKEEQKLLTIPCPTCGTASEKVISAPASHLVVPGNHDFSDRQTARLDKRHQDYVNGKGKLDLHDQRQDAIKRVMGQAGLG